MNLVAAANDSPRSERAQLCPLGVALLPRDVGLTLCVKQSSHRLDATPPSTWRTRFWTAAAERSGDGALVSRAMELARRAGLAESVVALRLPPQSTRSEREQFGPRARTKSPAADPAVRAPRRFLASFFYRALAALFLCAATFGASAFTLRYDAAGNVIRWNLSATNTANHPNVLNPSTRALRYFLASDGLTATNTAAELNGVRAAFAQWQAVPGAGLKFEDAGLIAPGVDVNLNDHTNVVFWAKSSTFVNGGLDNIFGALGATYTATFADGTLREADIVLNGVQFAWFTDWFDTNNAGYFVESVALHEIGHFIGLNHSPVGGATMLAQGSTGVGAQAGLALDDLEAARALYPAVPPLPGRVPLRGQVTKNGAGILGAVVTVEDTAGNIFAGTVTRTAGGTNGYYEFTALPVGDYQVRVTPLDAAGAVALITGQAIGISGEFTAADTSFLATGMVPISLVANTTNTLDLAVTNGLPPFHISDILTADGDFARAVPVAVGLGQTNLIVGVLSADAPASGVTLSITGDGLTVGATTMDATSFGGFKLFTVTLDVATNATPGLRSFVLQQGTNLAYANGFLEVLPAVPDYNFDGLDDAFQRRYFALFTAAAAAPNADPDGDDFSNVAEYISGTVPTNAASLLRIESLTQTATGTTLAWQSVPGKRYQISSRAAFLSAPWLNFSPSVMATNTSATFLDPGATNGMKFYRVQVLP